jgi:hypothetical protein
MKFVELIDKVWNEGMQDAASYRTHREILKLIPENAKSAPEVDYDGTKWQLKFHELDEKRTECPGCEVCGFEGDGSCLSESADEGKVSRGLMFEFSRLSSLVNMANLHDGEPGVICRATPSRLPQAFSWLYGVESEQTAEV